MTSFSSAYPSSVIKSVQYGSIAVNSTGQSGTATIASVATGKAVLHFLGVENADSTSYSTTSASASLIGLRITLTNATTVTATRNNPSIALNTTVNFVVVEYN